MRILVVEDDPQLLQLLTEGFREHGIEVVTASTFQEGRERAFMGGYAVIVLDIMLPGGSGVELCTRLRNGGVSTPVIMLTARDTVDDKVTGLASGADDYLVKPFAFRELHARVQALARRPVGLLPSVFTLEDLEVDLRTRKVKRAGAEVALTTKEFELLDLFIRNAGAVVDRAAITAHVWDDNHDPFTNALEVLVRRLRRKIDDDYDLKLIHTVRGAGYRLGT